jgi:hypothetical protein
LVPAADYTNLALSGTVVVTGPVHDVTIEFASTAPFSSFTLNGDAHDVTVIGAIPAGDLVELNGNVHDVKTGDIAGATSSVGGGVLLLTGNAHDVTMGNISGTAQLGKTFGGTFGGTMHDFTAGDVSGVLFVVDTFHDGTVGHISGPFGFVSLLSSGFHHFKTKSTNASGFIPIGSSVAATTGDGGILFLASAADEGSVQFGG